MAKSRFPVEVRATRSELLGMPPARFLCDYWQKRPLLIRGAFPGFQPPLSPDDLAGLACMDSVLARIVLREIHPKSSFRGRSQLYRERNPTAFAGLQTRTPKAARRASAKDGASQSASAYSERADYSPHPAAHPSATGSADVRSGILPPQSGSRLGRVRNDEKWEVRTGPFKEDIFARLPERDWTLLVQDVDKWDVDTAALLGHFAFIPSWRIDDVMVSYATDGGGVGAHVDQYDVFLVQGLGRRRWTIDTRPNPSSEFRDDVELKLLREFHPTHEWILEPGDVLYLPPGVPHDGVAVGECMTYSIGMRAPAASELLLDFAERLAGAMPESRRFADPDLAPAAAPGEIDEAALRRARRALGSIAAALDENAFADWFGGYVTRYRSVQLPVPRRRAVDPVVFAERLPRTLLRRDPWSRFAWRRQGNGARLYAAGAAFDAPVAWARELASGTRTFDGAKLARLPQPARGRALLVALVHAGHVTYHRR